MINTISFLCSLMLFGLAFSTASDYTITGASCVYENAQLNEVPPSDVPLCSTTFLLPPNRSVYKNFNNNVWVFLDVFRCDFSYRTAFGLPVVERDVLLAQAGLALDNFYILDLGSSTDSVRLAAAVQARGFNLYYGPFITLTRTATPVPSEFASRQQFLPRGPDFNITLTGLTAFPPSYFFNHTYVEYFPGVIQGTGTYENVHSLGSDNYAELSATCTVSFDNHPENCLFGEGIVYHGPALFTITQQETPLVPATC